MAKRSSKIFSLKNKTTKVWQSTHNIVSVQRVPIKKDVKTPFSFLLNHLYLDQGESKDEILDKINGFFLHLSIWSCPYTKLSLLPMLVIFGLIPSGLWSMKYFGIWNKISIVLFFKLEFRSHVHMAFGSTQHFACASPPVSHPSEPHTYWLAGPFAFSITKTHTL